MPENNKPRNERRDVHIHTSLSNKPTQTTSSDKTAMVTGAPSLERNEMKTPNKSCVLITGASSGFGEEFARQYAELGHSLVLVARRLDRLQRLAETLRQQFHVDVVVERVDLSDVAAVSQLHQPLPGRDIAIAIPLNHADHG